MPRLARWVSVRLMGMAVLAALASPPSAAGPAVVMEPSSGLVIYAEDLDRRWHPASLTKLMTAYLTFEAIRDGKTSLQDKVVCSPTAHSQPPSKIGLPVGAEMPLETALKALIVKSANDVAVMLAEKVAGSVEAFVEKMNATAKRLGMTRTRFVNPNGLPDVRQVTTARDMALLTRALLKEFPEYAYLYSLPSFRLGKRRLRSHNELLRTFDGADGIKTGFICDSGFNIVASATRDGRQLVAVVLGAHSSGARRKRASALLDYGFETYLWKTLFSASIDNIGYDDALDEPAPKLRPVVCGRRKAVKRKKRTRRRKSRTRRNKK